MVLDNDVCSSLKEFCNLVRLSWMVQEEVINQHGYTDDLQLLLFHPKATRDTYTEQLNGDNDGDSIHVDPADYTV